MSDSIVLSWPDPLLSTVCKEVKEFGDRLNVLEAELKKCMYWYGGLGIAANQIGSDQRVIFCQLGVEKTETLLVNPTVESVEDVIIDRTEEECLSIPGVKGVLRKTRWFNIRVASQDADGKPFVIELKGRDAVLVQHEVDHLNGKTILDRMSRLDRRRAKQRIIKRKRS